MENITEQKYKIEELKDTKINKLTILEEGQRVRDGNRNRRTVVCKCDCGNIKQVKLLILMRGEIKSCGKCHENLVGAENGYLEVISTIGINNNKQRVLKVKCNNCGNESEMLRSKFNRKEHCGCLKTPPKKPEPKPIKINIVRGIFEIKQELNRKSEGGYRMVLAKCTKCGSEHELVYENISTQNKGQRCHNCPNKPKTYRGKPLQTKEHKKLKIKHKNMKQRCFNTEHKDYHRYGGRGIKICDEWLLCRNFVEWGLNNEYQIGLEIDRIDNNKNYSPDNCRWVTKKQNSRNTRTVKLNEKDVWEIRYGKHKDISIRDVSKIYNCSEGAISSVRRLKSWVDIKEDYF